MIGSDEKFSSQWFRPCKTREISGIYGSSTPRGIHPFLDSSTSLFKMSQVIVIYIFGVIIIILSRLWFCLACQGLGWWKWRLPVLLDSGISLGSMWHLLTCLRLCLTFRSAGVKLPTYLFLFRDSGKGGWQTRSNDLPCLIWWWWCKIFGNLLCAYFIYSDFILICGNYSVHIWVTLYCPFGSLFLPS
jgi:hypothetical protein